MGGRTASSPHSAAGDVQRERFAALARDHRGELIHCPECGRRLSAEGMLYHYEAEHAGAAPSAASSGMPSHSAVPRSAVPRSALPRSALPRSALPAPVPASLAPTREWVEQLVERTNPQHDVTCPSCGEDVPGRDLLNHYDQNHAWEPGSQPHLLARGSAGGFVLPMVLSCFGMLIGMVARDDFEPGSIWAKGMVALLVLSMAVFFLAMGVMFFGKAALEGADDHLVLRQPMWPARALRLPLRSHLVGKLQDRDQYITSTVGLYLELRFANGTLRVGCVEETLSTFQARWLSPVGKKRGDAREHIRLGREDFYALQLWLHQKGQLEPKKPRSSRRRSKPR